MEYDKKFSLSGGVPSKLEEIILESIKGKPRTDEKPVNISIPYPVQSTFEGIDQEMPARRKHLSFPEIVS